MRHDLGRDQLIGFGVVPVVAVYEQLYAGSGEKVHALYCGV
jgi:hypothetical protein